MVTTATKQERELAIALRHGQVTSASPMLPGGLHTAGPRPSWHPPPSTAWDRDLFETDGLSWWLTELMCRGPGAGQGLVPLGCPGKPLSPLGATEAQRQLAIFVQGVHRRLPHGHLLQSLLGRRRDVVPAVPCGTRWDLGCSRATPHLPSPVLVVHVASPAARRLKRGLAGLCSQASQATCMSQGPV